MQKRTITVLGHQVEYDSGNIVLNQDAEDLLSDAIADTIELTEKLADTEELWMELDRGDFTEPVTVTWKVVNEADKWREIAGKLWWWLSTYIEAYPEHEGHQVYNILKQYEQLIEDEKSN